MAATQVAVIMGSSSDKKVMKACLEYLDHFGISYEAKVLSAHRNPEALDDYIHKLMAEDIQVIIAGAGMAAALPGVIAAKTSIPVIGVPLDSSSLSGTDALYSIVQMPKGIPVGCMAIGSSGAVNAVLYALRIMSLSDERLREKLTEHRGSLKAGK